MNKDLAYLHYDSLAKISFAELQPQSVSAVLLSLGSNYQADYHLQIVRKSLAELGAIKLSSAFENPDITATRQQPKASYVNQCVSLNLSKSITLAELQQLFKDLEQHCGRQRSLKSNVEQVSMDIDILLVKLANDQNSLSNDKDEWIVVAERYPFKEHEKAGIKDIKKEARV